MVSKEQHIRAMALDSAVRLAAAPNIRLASRVDGRDELAKILDMADSFADYIQMGRDDSDE